MGEVLRGLGQLIRILQVRDRNSLAITLGGRNASIRGRVVLGDGGAPSAELYMIDGMRDVATLWLRTDSAVTVRGAVR